MEKKKAFMKIRFMVYQDGTGNLWIATENGLFRLLVDSDTFVSYGKSDGILDKDYDSHTLHFSSRYKTLVLRKRSWIV